MAMRVARDAGIEFRCDHTQDFPLRPVADLLANIPAMEGYLAAHYTFNTWIGI
jgi:hypothetical protein